MSFDFIPRKVARPRSSSSRPSNSVPVVIPQINLDSSLKEEDKGKGKEVASLPSEDYAALIQLSLAEYALWFDSDLCRRITDTSTEGFVPISYLCRNSHYLSALDPLPSEAVIVKAVRTHLSEYFETRILFSAPLRSEWHAQGSSYLKKEDAVGGYEIRRKDWERLAEKIASHNKRDWDAKTLYVEKAPPWYRSIAAMCRFVGKLPGISPLEVQNITLPRHYMDKEDTQPKPKGFAFITFLSSQSVESLLHKWPWEKPNSDLDSSDVVQEALRFGFRAIHKARWEKLKDEYLTYRQQLLDEIAASEDGASVLAVDRNHSPERSIHNSSLQNNTSSLYPHGCLIYVRNVHPETNKTTLRTLFTSAIGGSPEMLDYVDFTKGMDSCFLRVKNPQYNQMLIDHFNANSVVQSSGLGGTASSSSADKAIVMEMVLGKKEELYWEKVPEKIRRSIVEKGKDVEDLAKRPSKRQRRGGRFVE